MMRLLRALAAFWYDFVIGEDWKIAAYTVVALSGVALLGAATFVGDGLLAVVGTAVLNVCFAVGVWWDARRMSR